MMMPNECVSDADSELSDIEGARAVSVRLRRKLSTKNTPRSEDFDEEVAQITRDMMRTSFSPSERPSCPTVFSSRLNLDDNPEELGYDADEDANTESEIDSPPSSPSAAFAGRLRASQARSNSEVYGDKRKQELAQSLPFPSSSMLLNNANAGAPLAKRNNEMNANPQKQNLTQLLKVSSSSMHVRNNLAGDKKKYKMEKNVHRETTALLQFPYASMPLNNFAGAVGAPLAKKYKEEHTNAQQQDLAQLFQMRTSSSMSVENSFEGGAASSIPVPPMLRTPSFLFPAPMSVQHDFPQRKSQSDEAALPRLPRFRDIKYYHYIPPVCSHSKLYSTDMRRRLVTVRPSISGLQPKNVGDRRWDYCTGRKGAQPQNDTGSETD